MNFKHLQAFLTLYQKRSFTKAAAALNCAQSGVTTQIRLLEESLGVLLFERIGKTVVPTAEGERLLPYAKKMLALSDEIQTLYAHSKRLTVGATESVARYLVLGILKEYAALAPETEIFLKLIHENEYAPMLCNGEIDVAIVLDVPTKNKSLQVVQKRRENILLAAASMHELAGRTRIFAEDFAKYAVLLPEKNCIYRQLFEQKLHAEGILPKIALESDSVSILKESSLCGIGLGLLPEFAVKKELIYHMLEKINFPLDVRIDTQILIHPDKWISPALEGFLEVAKRNLNSF